MSLEVLQQKLSNIAVPVSVERPIRAQETDSARMLRGDCDVVFFFDCVCVP